MQRFGVILWRWGRGVVAAVLAYFMIGLALVHTGGRVAPRLPWIGFALVSLGWILVGIWKVRTLEIIGWSVMLLLIIALCG
jgi:hypothetical protein